MSDGSLYSDLGHKVSMLLELQSVHSSEVRFGRVLLWLLLLVLRQSQNENSALKEPMHHLKMAKEVQKSPKVNQTRCYDLSLSNIYWVDKTVYKFTRFDFNALLLLSTHVRQSRIWKESKSQGSGPSTKAYTYCPSYWRGNMVRLHLKMQSQE